jgi:ElaA protein
MITWLVKSFNQLSPHELYAILQLRNEVFVVEQNCAYQDADNKDPASEHMMGLDENGKLIAYVRLVPKGISYADYPAIGRVVSSPAVRGTGAGRAVMNEAINWIEKHWNEPSIRIGAQLYLKKFYESLGFVQSSEIYDEDGIAHIEMTRHPVL